MVSSDYFIDYLTKYLTIHYRILHFGLMECSTNTSSILYIIFQRSPEVAMPVPLSIKGKYKNYEQKLLLPFDS